MPDAGISERVKLPSIPSLTGIRGVAAVWVLFFHLNALFPRLIHNSSFITAGYHAVDLFFILSGFILMYVHSQDFIHPTWLKTCEFYAARVTRVYPLNATILFGILIAFSWQTRFITWSRIQQPGSYSVAGFYQTLILANRWGRSLGEWNEPTWSLSLEIVGYVLFPFLVLGISRVRRAWVSVLLGLTSLSLLILFQALTHTLYINSIGRLGAVRMLLGFFCGMLMCHLRQLAPFLSGTPKRVAWISCVLITGCIFVGPLHPLLVFPFASLIWALSYREGFVNTVLADGFAVYLGRISFALYLVHIPIFRYTEYLIATINPDAPIAFLYVEVLLAVALSFGLATILYRWVEAPMHRLGRRLFGAFMRSGTPSVA